MTVAEVYKEIAAHMIKGMMIHEQLANYYDFLGLDGYKKCHEYHYLMETCSYRKVCQYYINHHNKLIDYMDIENPHIIPNNWYGHSQSEVDVNTKRNAVKTGLHAWIDWETDTKKLYEQMYKELMNNDAIASACMIRGLIEDVDHELCKAQKYLINKEMVSYSIESILSEQHDKKEKYEFKMKTELIQKIC